MLLLDHFVVAHTSRGSLIRFNQLSPDGPFALVCYERQIFLRRGWSESIARSFMKSIKIDELLDPFECLRLSRLWSENVSSPVSSSLHAAPGSSTITDARGQ